MKTRFFTVIALCVLLGLLVGCVDSGESEKTEDPGNIEVIEGMEQPQLALNRMEPLQFEDPDNENLADLLQRNGNGMMVQLQAGNLLGSGVICGIEEDKLLILTAAHVLEEVEGFVLVTFADGARVVTDDFECFTSGDFAVVKVTGGSIPEDTLGQYLCANIDKESFDAATAGTGCIAMGSRSGVAAEAYEGVILDHWIYMEDYGQYMMWVKAEGMQGMSGGGLFDRQGHFLGILSGGNEDGELAVVPLSLILTEINLQEFDP